MRFQPMKLKMNFACLITVFAVNLLSATAAHAAAAEKTEILFAGPAGSPTTLAEDASGNLYTSFVVRTAGGFTNQIVKLTPNSNGSWTQQVIYRGFPNESAEPSYVDAKGNLFGTTFTPGGQSNCGIVFELSPSGKASWTETTLHTFPCFGSGASGELSPLIADSKGNLYGGSDFANFYYSLSPTAGGHWHYSVIYNCRANCGLQLVADAEGNLYGASAGIFKLTPNGEGNLWTYTSLYSFNAPVDGSQPSGLSFDSQGNLFGANSQGGADAGGTVFELSPTSGGGWTFSLLWSFASFGPEGSQPLEIYSPSPGELIGTNFVGGASGLGAVFSLTQSQGGEWSETVVHSFAGSPNDGEDPGYLLTNPSGNSYGLASGGLLNCAGSGCGILFEVTP